MSLSHDSRKRVRVFFHVGQLKKPWVYSVLLLSTQEAARAHTKKSDLARGRERHFRTGKRADSLDTTLFRLPVLALPFSPTSSGRHYAGFPVAIKTPGICVNFALINEIMLFGIISELISRITWSISLFYSVYLGKSTASFILDSRKETIVGKRRIQYLRAQYTCNWGRPKAAKELFFDTFL